MQKYGKSQGTKFIQPQINHSKRIGEKHPQTRKLRGHLKIRDGERGKTWSRKTKKRSCQGVDMLRYVKFGVTMRHLHGDVYNLFDTVYV